MIENHDTKQIEQMLSYLFENFDTISALIEREKNKPKAVFGFKAGGVFNPTKEDVLWGSGLGLEQSSNHHDKCETPNLGLDNKEEPLGEAPTISREKPAVDLYSTTDIIIEEPLPSTKEADNDALTNDTTDSSTSNSLLRDEDEATGTGDNSITTEPRGVEYSNSSNETEDDERGRDGETRGLEDRREDVAEPSTKVDSTNPWHKPKPKKSGSLFNSSITHTQPVIERNINHDSFYEQEYKEKCEKKGWEYKTKEQRHEEAKAGAEKIRKLSRPFDDFRKLW